MSRLLRLVPAALLLFTLIAPGHAQDAAGADKTGDIQGEGAEQPDAEQPDAEPTESPVPAVDPLLYEPRYHSLDEVRALLAAWAAAHPEAHLIDLGVTRGGLQVPAIEIRKSGPSAELDEPAAGQTAAEASSDTPGESQGAQPAGQNATGQNATGVDGGAGAARSEPAVSIAAPQDGEVAASAEPALEGEQPVRATFFLLGGLDGRSSSGCEAVLATCARLLEKLDELRDDVAVIGVPWAAPDGLAAIHAGRRSDGLNDRSLDADRDGLFDEDGPDDLDGDGVLLSMLVEDPAGPWTFGADARLVVPARAGDRPRLILAPEGRDDDGDGRFNEDGPGGVNLDENFPIAWEGFTAGGAGGELPLSEPLARRLADMLVGRATAAVIVMQGAHGGLARPRSEALFNTAPEFFQSLPARWSRATGRPLVGLLDLSTAAAAPRPGSLVDWVSACLGVPAFELAPWGPELGLDPATRKDPAQPGSSGPVSDARMERERAWMRWLDDKRGGIGFVPWQSVRLEGGRLAHVGGWSPRTRLNPSEHELAQALEGCAEFVLELIEGCAIMRLELSVRRIEGGLVSLSARVLNEGRLPLGSGRIHGGGLELELFLPDGVRLLAGEERVHLAALAGGRASEAVEYLLVVPAGARIEVRVRAAGAGQVSEEVRL